MGIMEMLGSPKEKRTGLDKLLISLPLIRFYPWLFFSVFNGPRIKPNALLKSSAYSRIKLRKYSLT
jgi:hypothetical protein